MHRLLHGLIQSGIVRTLLCDEEITISIAYTIKIYFTMHVKACADVCHCVPHGAPASPGSRPCPCPWFRHPRERIVEIGPRCALCP